MSKKLLLFRWLIVAVLLGLLVFKWHRGELRAPWALLEQTTQFLDGQTGEERGQPEHRGAAGAATDATADAAFLRQVAGRIAAGHAFAKHGAELGVADRRELAVQVERILRNPTARRALSGGRSAYWDAASGTVVILNPRDRDGGTTFRPSRGRAYFERLQ